MKFFKFIKIYSNFNIIVNEFKKRKSISEIQMTKHYNASVNNKHEIAAYHRKKYEYYKGKTEAYVEIINIIEKFINNQLEFEK